MISDIDHDEDHQQSRSPGIIKIIIAYAAGSRVEATHLPYEHMSPPLGVFPRPVRKESDHARRWSDDRLDHVRCHLGSNFHSSSSRSRDFHLSAGQRIGSDRIGSVWGGQSIERSRWSRRIASFCSIALFKRSMYHLAYNPNTPTNKQTSQMPNNCNFPYFCRVYDRRRMRWTQTRSGPEGKGAV